MRGRKKAYRNKNFCVYFTHLPRSPLWRDLHKILRDGSPRRRNQPCQILSQSDQGFWFCGGSNFWISHRKEKSPLTQGLNYRSACDTKYARQTRTTVISHTCTISSIKQNYALCYVLLPDCTIVKIELLARVVVRPFVRRPSVCHGCIVAKRCKIEPKLLLITNRKSHTDFQMRYKSQTLDDLKESYACFPTENWPSRKRWEIRHRLVYY